MGLGGLIKLFEIFPIGEAVGTTHHHHKANGQPVTRIHSIFIGILIILIGFSQWTFPTMYIGGEKEVCHPAHIRIIKLFT